MIADAARTLPHTMRRVDTLAELEVLVGYDDDLAGEVTRISNRIRGLLTQIHPPLMASRSHRRIDRCTSIRAPSSCGE